MLGLSVVLETAVVRWWPSCCSSEFCCCCFFHCNCRNFFFRFSDNLSNSNELQWPWPCLDIWIFSKSRFLQFDFSCFPFPPFYFRLRRNIKHAKQCFTTFRNTSPKMIHCPSFLEFSSRCLCYRRYSTFIFHILLCHFYDLHLVVSGMLSTFTTLNLELLK